MSDCIALVDMDGTLVDYDGVMRRDLEKLRSPGEPEYEPTPGGEFPDWLEARRRVISLQPGWWRALPRLEMGFDILGALQAHGFSIHVLTKGPSRKPAAWSEKVEWCRAHLPPEVEVTVTENKSLSYGRVLVDDWPPYFMGWLTHRPRGVVIVPAQPWNEGVEQLAPRNIFRYDRTELHSLNTVLKAVRERANGEALDVATILERTRGQGTV